MSDEAAIRAKWREALFDTAPADRAAAEAAVKEFYAAAGLQPPRIIWFDSPIPAAWAVAALAEPYSWLGQSVIGNAKTAAEKKQADEARAKLAAAFGMEWKSVPAAAGAPLVSSFMCMGPTGNIHQQMVSARMSLSSDVGALFRVFDDKDDLARAEKFYLTSSWGVLCTQAHIYMLNAVLAANFYKDYSFSTMAADAAKAEGKQAPALLSSAWNIARNAGLWWPFAHLAILCDRPAEIHRNAEGLLHNGDGPAVLFRDGNRLYAWKGRSMKEQWVMQPETIPPGQLKQLDADFRKHVAQKTGGKPKVAKPRASAILSADLPADAPARLAVLRQHAGGKLPLFDRYIAGEHKKVWQELVAQGAAVREDPLAADALAVAYETMRRVEQNIRTVTQRLQEMKYKFKHPKEAHTPPGAKTLKQLRKLEKSTGGIPLSLRAFYEIVGGVNWMGAHPAMTPKGSSIAADPLTVFPVDDALAALEGMEDDGVVVIAPDDLHKEDTSGGDPYALMVPDPRADGELLNERHSLFFVDYLRLALLQFRGFPGYDGTDGAPRELEALRAGLLAF